MKSVAVAVTLLLLTPLPGVCADSPVAAAAPPAPLDLLKTLCVATRADWGATTAAADRLGWTILPDNVLPKAGDLTMASGLHTTNFTVRFRSTPGNEMLLIVGTEPEGMGPRCALISHTSFQDAHSALTAWLGYEPYQSMGPTAEGFIGIQDALGRRSIAGMREEDVMQARSKGQVEVFEVLGEAQQSILSYNRP